MPGAVFGAGLAALVLVTFAAARVAAEPLSHPLGCGAGPNEFRVTTFASGLNFPYGMQKLADGSLLVATSKPNAVNGSYFASTGELLRFADENKDGIADGPPTVLYSGSRVPSPVFAAPAPWCSSPARCQAVRASRYCAPVQHPPIRSR